MRSKLVVGLIVALVAVFFVSMAAVGQQRPSRGEKLLCVSSQELKGQETVASCLAKGERFAVVDPYGLVRILTPEEVELSRAMNPKVFEIRAFGLHYERLAPSIAPLPGPGPEAPGG